jgi:hypothetical protein
MMTKKTTAKAKAGARPKAAEPKVEAEEPKVEPKAPAPKPAAPTAAEAPPEPPTPAPEPTPGLGPQRIDRAGVFVVKDHGPVKNLAPVQFADWKAPGIAITGDKAKQHADNLRLVADVIPAEHKNYVLYLRGFADQLSPKSTPQELSADKLPGDYKPVDGEA